MAQGDVIKKDTIKLDIYSATDKSMIEGVMIKYGMDHAHAAKLIRSEVMKSFTKENLKAQVRAAYERLMLCKDIKDNIGVS